eukprot:6103934-Prymnesium_polylepis.1
MAQASDPKLPGATVGRKRKAAELEPPARPTLAQLQADERKAEAAVAKAKALREACKAAVKRAEQQRTTLGPPPPVGQLFYAIMKRFHEEGYPPSSWHAKAGGNEESGAKAGGAATGGAEARGTPRRAAPKAARRRRAAPQKAGCTQDGGTEAAGSAEAGGAEARGTGRQRGRRRGDELRGDRRGNAEAVGTEAVGTEAVGTEAVCAAEVGAAEAGMEAGCSDERLSDEEYRAVEAEAWQVEEAARAPWARADAAVEAAREDLHESRVALWPRQDEASRLFYRVWDLEAAKRAAEQRWWWAFAWHTIETRNAEKKELQAEIEVLRTENARPQPLTRRGLSHVAGCGSRLTSCCARGKRRTPAHVNERRLTLTLSGPKCICAASDCCCVGSRGDCVQDGCADCCVAVRLGTDGWQAQACISGKVGPCSASFWVSHSRLTACVALVIAQSDELDCDAS